MPALSNFLKDELARRGWEIPDFIEAAKRIGPGLSQSNGYLIIRDGKDNVRQDTFDLIAATLSMSPAELATAIGKGPATDDPKRAPIHAAVREVPEESLSTLDKIIRSLAVKSVKARTNGRRDASANRRLAAAAELAQSTHPTGHSDLKDNDNKALSNPGARSRAIHSGRVERLLVTSMAHP